jgi:hypothetical protein
MLALCAKQEDEMPQLVLGKLTDDHWRASLTTANGKVVADVSIDLLGRQDTRSDKEKRAAALTKVKALSAEFLKAGSEAT